MIPGSDSVTLSGSRAPLALPRILASDAGIAEWFLTEPSHTPYRDRPPRGAVGVRTTAAIRRHQDRQR